MRKLSIALIFLTIISPIWTNGYTIANERTSSYSEKKEILVKYKDEVIETWRECLLEPETSSFFSQDNKPVAEDFIPEIGVVKYKISPSLSMAAVIKAFETDERVQLVAANDTRFLDPYMVKSHYKSCSEAVYDGVYQNPSYKEQWALQQYDIPKIREKIG